MTQAFILNIKPNGKDLVSEALRAGVILIGWGKSKGLLNESLTRDRIREILHRDYHPNERTYRRAGAATHTVLLFLREMEVGDIVVVPHKKEFYVAIVSSHPNYKALGDSSTRYYQRAVRWLNVDNPFQRADAPSVLTAQMQKRPTLSPASDALKEINMFLAAHSLAAIDVFEAAGISQDLDHIKHSSIDMTTKNALIQARLGQALFRKQLLERWNNQCGVTGCRTLEAIRAFHARPWRHSSNAERLNPENGIPLIATLDALFDVGLVSFSADGKMLVSSKISHNERVLLGLPSNLRQRITPGQRRHLGFHRRNVFRP